MLLPRATKVICYVVREGEPPAHAALRETEGETGRASFAIVRKLDVYQYEFHDRFREGERHELHERHVFLLAPPPHLPEQWSHLAEPGAGDFWFRFSWTPLVPDLTLAGDQHALLSRVAR